MKSLWLSGITGLYNEMYFPNPDGLQRKAIINNQSLNAGEIFWSGIFEEKRLQGLISMLEKSIDEPASHSPQFRAILANPDLYIDRVMRVKKEICDQGTGEIAFYSSVEMLAITCELYSRFEFFPFRLTVQNGILLDENSSEKIIKTCLDPAYNPYIDFIEKNIISIIADYNPTVLFCCGKISYFHVATAMMLKKKIKNIHICVTRHASEYYSLNKITKYLVQNESLFTIFDSIILENFIKTESDLQDAINCNKVVSTLPDIITCKCRHTEDLKISQEAASTPSIFHRKKQKEKLTLPPSDIFDVHLQPNAICYWNKCAFCGINSKYSHKNRDSIDQLKEQIDIVIRKIPSGKYIWFIDEAIRPQYLRELATRIIQDERQYCWQARCRIDAGLLDDGLPQLLAKSGLKELRLGLESASLKVLKLMNKFPASFSFDMLERIVKAYTQAGIAIHFPMILGFPGETKADRQQSYTYLADLRKRYPLVTFNLNIFSLDVASPIFKVWDEYAISEVKLPCEATSFIGNYAQWDDRAKPDERVLDQERNSFMKEQLYPWMPPHSITTPVIFYRLSETIRNTLTWKNAPLKDTGICLDLESVVVKNCNLSSRTEKEVFFVYNWETHHYVVGNDYTKFFFDAWSSPCSIKNGIEKLTKINCDIFYESDILVFLKKCINFGHIVYFDPL